jgi:competence protein ComEC
MGSLAIWRIFIWNTWRDELFREGSEVEMVLTQALRVNDFSCTFLYRGVFHLVEKDMCEESGLLHAQLGDRLQVTGKGVDSEQYGKQVRVLELEVEFVKYPKLISGWWWRRHLDSFRVYVSGIVRKVMPEPEASLVTGIVTGDRAAMPGRLHEALVATGTLHVVAASGYNVTVVAGMVMRVMLGFTGRRRSILAAMVAVWLYALMAGADPPVVRAALLLSLTLLASYLGRTYWQLWSFGCVVWVLLALSPWYVESVSFQLSIAATVGVIWGSQTVERWRKCLGERRKRRHEPALITEYLPKPMWKLIWNKLLLFLWPQIETTVGAWVMTTPVLLVVFGQTSWLGLVVNPIVLGVVPLLMLLGAIVMMGGILWLPLAQVFAFITWPVAYGWVKTVEIFGSAGLGVIEMTFTWPMAIGWWLVAIGVMAATLSSPTRSVYEKDK